MDFSQISGVYSRRNQDSRNAPASLTSEFRYRVKRLCDSTFTLPPERAVRDVVVHGRRAFWVDMRSQLQYLHGRNWLAESSSQGTREKNDAVTSLYQCRDEHFLDFIELIFQLDSYWWERIDSGDLINAVNKFLRIDDLPYSLTNFAYRGYSITAYPQVIRRDSEFLHETAIQPTLALLADPVFASANQEFLDAPKDYRQGDYPDCITKCGSSFESVMKIICGQKGWPYQQDDDVKTLVNSIFSQTGVDRFFKQPIMLIATIRNRLGSAHGAGAEPRDVPPHIAQYAINATASAILLLVEATENIGTG